MELNMLEAKFLSLPKDVGFRTSSYPTSLFGIHSYPKSNSSKVICSRVSNSATSNKVATSTLLFQSKINGINEAISRTLDYFDDEYGGVIVNSDKLPSNPNVFASLFQSSLSQWITKGKKGVWLKLPSKYSELVPIAIKEGFQYHHAESGYVMLTYWIPEGPCMLPANASHQVGVGGFVINDKNEVLVVQEKYCAPPFVGFWKIPTGFIHESEEIYTGAVREVQEETGIDTEFVEVIAFRHAQNMAFEKSDLFFICMLKPLSSEIKVDDHEIIAAKWMPVVEFVKQPWIQEDSMLKKVTDIFIARMGKKYCGLFAHHLISKFDDRSSTLYYNVVNTRGSNCIGA
ncbi:nudix hydrolase 8-like [Chenopodium quinoa]|uniref:Nudix hydrolase domain-containing protein n=1 Tax=Chenopodium quinoa TaxID=63459 RepID=A0A803LUI7_CHEQI|nr:nudix hydrolase 8-like [Chenopodium quinoa]